MATSPTDISTLGLIQFATPPTIISGMRVGTGYLPKAMKNYFFDYKASLWNSIFDDWIQTKVKENSEFGDDMIRSVAGAIEGSTYLIPKWIFKWLSKEKYQVFNSVELLSSIGSYLVSRNFLEAWIQKMVNKYEGDEHVVVTYK